jgi:hypothetical protein
VATDARRAYVDRPIGDLDAAVRAARAAADHWRLDPPVLVRQGMNAIFVSGDVVLRAANPSVPADASLRLAEHLRRRGIRVPAPRRDDVVVEGSISVTAWERVEDTGGRIDWCDVGAMIRLVHGLDARTLPHDVPLPHPSALPWWHFDALLAGAGDALDERAREGLLAAVERHRAWEHLDEHVVCHGDVHPGNVLAGPDGPVLLDWDLLCRAPAGWDHAPLLTWHERWGGDAAIYDDFATGYGKSFVGDPAAMAFAELRLVAATLMRVLASIDDPRARPEAERRLRYWRGDPDAPSWTAQ